MRQGIVAEYADAGALLHAIRTLRLAGWTRLDAFTPHSVPALDAALGARRSPLAWAAGAGGIAGATAAYALEWWLNASLYPVVTGGRPPHMPLPYLIIAIEMGFLAGALAVVSAFAIAARLGRLWDPVDEVPGFESATRDGFWVVVDAADPVWGAERVRAVLASTDPRRISGFGGVP